MSEFGKVCVIHHGRREVRIERGSTPGHEVSIDFGRERVSLPLDLAREIASALGDVAGRGHSLRNLPA